MVDSVRGLRAVHVSNTALPKVGETVLNGGRKFFSDSSSRDKDSQRIGGFFLDEDSYWFSKGSVFVVASSTSGSLTSFFDFDHAFSNLRFKVKTCSMLHRFIIIGLKYSGDRGCVAVFNPYISQLVKAIDIPYPVSCLEIISSSGGAVTSTRGLNKNLRCLSGIVAVGTEEGHLFLVDLRLDTEQCFSGLISSLNILHPTSDNLSKMREDAEAKNAHIAFQMQAPLHQVGISHYTLPDDTNMESYPYSISISTLLYESRISSIFVGYSFGQFQIFCLHRMMLIYSSQLANCHGSVLRMAFQEPENDPRKCCYLWVAVGNQTDEVSDEKVDYPLTIVMFQLGFSKKSLLFPNTGTTVPKKEKPSICYKGFEGCYERFQCTLGQGLKPTTSQCYGASLLLCQSIETHSFAFKSQEWPDVADVVCGLSPSSSYCLFGWKTLGESSVFHTLMFDINRWYMAQMPCQLCTDEDDSMFIGYWSFDENAAALMDNEAILGVQIATDQIRQFSTGKKPLPEKFILPSATTLSMKYLTSCTVKLFSLLGYQDQVFYRAYSLKSMCLMNPQDIHGDLIKSALSTDYQSSQAFTPDMMRENILTAALEHGRMSLLLNMVKEIASGHLTSYGCTSQFVLDWAWKSVAHIKSAIDELSLPIFNCSCSTLDTQLRNRLQFYTNEICNLETIFRKLIEFAEWSTDPSKQEVNAKLNAVTLLGQYLSAVGWFIDAGLLPEQQGCGDDEDEDIALTSEGIIIYNYLRLWKMYSQRRIEFRREHDRELLIDCWIDKISPSLISRWQKCDDGKPNYPPPNLMSLLDIYYLDCIDVMTKHCIVAYFLNDLVAMITSSHFQLQSLSFDMEHKHQRVVSRIMSFVKSFDIPTSHVKLTQAFWLLDHNNFQDALSVLLDPDTNCAYESWQVRRILKAFLFHGHPDMALKFLSASHSIAETIEDSKLHISIYVKNREILKALSLINESCYQTELFHHIFQLSHELTLLEEILRLPHSPMEESMIMRYLNADPRTTWILILYHLQKANYSEAIRLHSEVNRNILMDQDEEESRIGNAKLDHLVQACTNFLPDIERKQCPTQHDQRIFQRHLILSEQACKPLVLPAKLHLMTSAKLESKARKFALLHGRMKQEKMSNQEVQMTPFRKRPFLPHKASNKATDFLVAKAYEKPTELRFAKIVQRSSLLLQTPPIARRRLSLERSYHPQLFKTPQSILKAKSNLFKVCDNLSLTKDSKQHSNNKHIYEDQKCEDRIPNDAGDNIKNGIPIVSTPHSHYVKQPKFISDSPEDKSLMLSTSCLKRSSLEDSNYDRHHKLSGGKLDGMHTPKKIRFVGTDSNHNDCIMPDVVLGSETSSLLSVKKSEDADDSAVDVDVLRDETVELSDSNEGDEIPEDACMAKKVKDNKEDDNNVLLVSSINEGDQSSCEIILSEEPSVQQVQDTSKLVVPSSECIDSDMVENFEELGKSEMGAGMEMDDALHFHGEVKRSESLETNFDFDFSRSIMESMKESDKSLLRTRHFDLADNIQDNSLSVPSEVATISLPTVKDASSNFSANFDIASQILSSSKVTHLKRRKSIVRNSATQEDFASSIIDLKKSRIFGNQILCDSVRSPEVPQAEKKGVEHISQLEENENLQLQISSTEEESSVSDIEDTVKRSNQITNSLELDSTTQVPYLSQHLECSFLATVKEHDATGCDRDDLQIQTKSLGYGQEQLVIPNIDREASSQKDSLKTEPTFVLSPPTTKRTRMERSAQCTSSKLCDSQLHTPDMVENLLQDNKQPSFVFSPPSTRTRSSCKKKEQIKETPQQLSIKASANIRLSLRRRTKTASKDGRHLSFVADSDNTCAIRTMSSLIQKNPSTPTRSSQRIKAQLKSTKASIMAMDDSVNVVHDSDTVYKRKSGPKNASTSSEVSAVMKSNQPTRRSTRRSVKKSRLTGKRAVFKANELSLLQESGKEDDVLEKVRFASESRTPREKKCSASYTTRVRKNTKILIAKAKK